MEETEEASLNLLDNEDRYFRFVGSLIRPYHQNLLCHLKATEAQKALHDSGLDKKIALGFERLTAALRNHSKLTLAHSIAYLAQIPFQIGRPAMQVSFPAEDDANLGLPFQNENEIRALEFASTYLRQLDTKAAEEVIADVVRSAPFLRYIFIFAVLRGFMWYVDRFPAENERRNAAFGIADSIDKLKDVRRVEDALDILVDMNQFLLQQGGCAQPKASVTPASIKFRRF